MSIPAGMAKMKLAVFLPLTILGTLIWNTILVHLGRLAGEAWEIVVSYLDLYSLITLAVFGLIALVIAAVFIKKRFLHREIAINFSRKLVNQCRNQYLGLVFAGPSFLLMGQKI